MHKFTKGESVKFQKNLDCKKDLEELGWKLDAPKKAEKKEEPKEEKKTVRKKKDK